MRRLRYRICLSLILFALRSSAESSLTPVQQAKLKTAEQALQLLHRARQNLDILHQPAPDSLSIENDSTYADLTSKSKSLENTPSTLGRFEILEVLGEGGFSRVFLARDPHLDRLVALKVPRPGALTDETSRQRFQREARAAAVLSHPAIVPTLEAGSAGPITYLAMGYCQGDTLAAWMKQNSASHRQAAQIISELALAIEHAHQRGIVHRDLKPANILIASEERRAPDSDEESQPPLRTGDDSIASRLRITDFGLAKYEAHDQELTQEGVVIGTPAYMSPEQATASSKITAATDIYSLGTILFELLSGKIPFRRENHLATLRAVESEPPPDLQKLASGLPRDLCAITEACLRKAPEERYASAFALAEDLRRWLNGMPVKARRVGHLEQLSKWVVRRPAIAGSLAFAFLSLAVGCGLATWKWREAQHHLRIAGAEYDRAELNVQKANDAVDRERAAREDAESARQDTDTFSSFLVHRVIAAARPKGKDGGLGLDVKLVDALKAAESDIESTFKGQPRAEAIARNALGATWRNLGDLQRAEQHFSLARAAATSSDQRLSTEASSAESSKRATGYDARGESAERNGSDEMNVIAGQAILAKLETASMVARRGKYAEALDILEQAQNEAQQQLGSSHPLTIGCMNNRAAILTNQDNHEAAAPLFKALLKQFTAQLGPDHVTTCKIRRNLAVTYRRLGQSADAAKLLEFQLDQQMKGLGEEDFETLKTMAELGDTYTQLKQPDRAQEYLEKAVRIAKPMLGTDHPMTMVAMRYLAANLRDRGDYESAVALHKETIQLAQQRYGNDHQETYLCETALLDTYFVSEKGEEAESLLRGVMPRYESEEKDDSQQSLFLQQQLARSFLMQRRLEEAVDLYQRVHARFQAKYGEGRLRTRKVLEDLADAQMQLGQPEAAVKTYKTLIKAQRSKLRQISY